MAEVGDVAIQRLFDRNFHRPGAFYPLKEHVICPDRIKLFDLPQFDGIGDDHSARVHPPYHCNELAIGGAYEHIVRYRTYDDSRLVDTGVVQSCRILQITALRGGT